jgi:hypothetical protein
MPGPSDTNVGQEIGTGRGYSTTQKPTLWRKAHILEKKDEVCQIVVGHMSNTELLLNLSPSRCGEPMAPEQDPSLGLYKTLKQKVSSISQEGDLG